MKIELLYESKKNAFLLTFNKHVITIFRWWPIQFYIRLPRRSVKALEGDIPKRRPAHRPIKAEEPLKRAAFGQVELIQPNLEHWVNKTFQQQVSSKDLEFIETFSMDGFKINMQKCLRQIFNLWNKNKENDNTFGREGFWNLLLLLSYLSIPKLLREHSHMTSDF